MLELYLRSSYVEWVEEKQRLEVRMEQLQADNNMAKFIYWSIKTKKMVPGVSSDWLDNTINIGHNQCNAVFSLADKQ